MVQKGKKRKKLCSGSEQEGEGKKKGGIGVGGLSFRKGRRGERGAFSLTSGGGAPKNFLGRKRGGSVGAGKEKAGRGRSGERKEGGVCWMKRRRQRGVITNFGGGEERPTSLKEKEK